MKQKFLVLGLLLAGINNSYALDCVDVDYLDNEFYRVEKYDQDSWLFQVIGKELSIPSCRSRWGCDYEEVIIYEEHVKRFVDEDFGNITWKGKNVVFLYEPDSGYFLKWNNGPFHEMECN